MGFLKELYWNTLLEFPLRYVNKGFLSGLPSWATPAYKVVATIILILVLWNSLTRGWRWIRKVRGRDKLIDLTEYEPYTTKDRKFVEELDAADHLETTLKPLIARKQYDRVGEILASLNQWKRAAKWFVKAKDYTRAAENLAKAGQTVKAAKLLVKAGDYATAARFFADKGKQAAAAKAHEKAGHIAEAANAYVAAGRHKDAARTFDTYFAATDDPPAAQVQNADACLAMLRSERGRAKVPEATRSKLLSAVAGRLDGAERHTLAAEIYREVGDLTRAGEVFMRAGKFEEAALCMRDAGRVKDAEQLMGRYLEGQQRWHEAGTAYSNGGDFWRAGECFAKAEDRARAAECYEKVRDFYRAGVAYIQGRQYENAVRALKQIPEDNSDYERSRLLIGRCYYAMKAYDLCAAALENQLGSQITQRNLEYFKMLGRAYSELDKLEEALSVFNKIKTLSVDVRDVDEHISSLQTRLSMRATKPGAPLPMGPAESRQMSVVESALGQRFQFERELGRGGMGVVYLARDTQLDRPVALKFLGALVDGSEHFRVRFFREARSAARVNHPNIVAIYDIGEDRGKVYIAMEYVAGQNLHHLLHAKGKLSPKEAAGILGQACAALEAIHKAGIVHRDIKPENILIAEDGLVKLMDFGLAKSEGPQLTQADQVVGTPCYMAPEQTLGRPVDARTDIYALGLVLHETLTGVTHFSSGDILRRQQTEMPPPPSQSVPGLPAALDSVVMKCIAKDPGDRFHTVTELRAALRQFA